VEVEGNIIAPDGPLQINGLTGRLVAIWEPRRDLAKFPLICFRKASAY